MTALTPRSREVAKSILESSHAVVIKRLAASLGVSPRTIRYDLELLKEWFKERDVSLNTKPRIGIWVECSAEARARLLADLDRWGPASRVMDKHERVHLLLLALIRSKKPVPLSKLADQMRVSRSTAANDMRDAVSIAESCNLKIIGRPRFGYQMHGDEHNRRELIYLLLVDLIDESKWLQMLSFSLRSNSAPENNAVIGQESYEWFARMNRDHMLSVGRVIRSELNTTLTDSGFVALVVHLSVALERITCGEGIFLDPAQLAALQKTEAYAISQRITDGISAALNVTIPEAEIGYVALHVLGRRETQQQNPSQVLRGEEVIARIQLFLVEIEEKLGFNLDTDAELQEGLFHHLQRYIVKLRDGYLERNPLTQRLMDEYPVLFAVVSDAAKRFLGHVSLNESEIGYLCMHIRASLERREEPKTCRAIVACSTGAGSATLLRARLSREFPDLQIVKITSALNVVVEAEASKADVVISTVGLPELGIPAVVVSPLLMPHEAEKIRTLIHRLPSGSNQICSSDNVDAWAIDLAQMLDGVRTTSKRALIIRDYLWNRVESLQAFRSTATVPDFVAREELIRFAKGLSDTLGVIVDREKLIGLAIHLSIAIQRWRLGQFSTESSDEIDSWTTGCSVALQVVNQKLTALASIHGVTQPPIEESIAVMRYFVVKPSL